MKELAERIRRDLESGREYCFVGEWELNEVWPEWSHTIAKLHLFAAKYGFRLKGYQPGVGAVFIPSRDRKPNGKSSKHS